MLSEKGQLMIEAILTTGNYRIIMIDSEDKPIKRLLKDESGLIKKPFEVKLTATPVT